MTTVTVTVTVATQAQALDVLHAIQDAFGHLPAPRFSIDDIWPDQLDIDLHGDLSAFETWRQALGIPTSAVAHRDSATQMTLRAESRYSDANIRLTGFAPACPSRTPNSTPSPARPPGRTPATPTRLPPASPPGPSPGRPPRRSATASMACSRMAP